MSVLFSFFSKTGVTEGDGTQQQNQVLDSTVCAVITIASVSDYSLFVLFGKQTVRGVHCLVLNFIIGDSTFLLTSFIVFNNVVYW